MKIHSRKMNLTRGINLRKVAEKMQGASGAESKVSSILIDKFTGKLIQEDVSLTVQFCH